MAGEWDIASPDTPAASGGWDVAEPDVAPETARERMARHRTILAEAPSFPEAASRTAMLATDALRGAAGTTAGGLVGVGSDIAGSSDAESAAAVKAAHDLIANTNPHSDIGAAGEALGRSGVGQTVASAGHALHQGLEGTFGPEGAAGIERVGGHVLAAAPVLGGIVKPAVTAIGDAAGVGIPTAERTLLADSAAAHAAATQARAADAINNRLKTAGYRVSAGRERIMTGAENPAGRTAAGIEAVAGPGAITDNVVHNIKTTNGWGATDIGLPRDAVLTPEALDSAEVKPAATYDKVRDRLAGKTPISAENQQALVAAGQDSLPPGHIMPPEVARAAEHFATEPMNASGLMKSIAALRKEGFKNKLSADTGANALGRAQVDQANALEAELNQRVASQAPDLAGDYQTARRQFAKIHTVRAAIKGFDIDPQAIRKLADKNEGIDGGLKIVADAATHLPEDVKLKAPGSAGHGAVIQSLGTGAGAVGAAAFGHPVAAGLLGAAAAASPIARGLLRLKRGVTPAGALNEAATQGVLKDRYFGGAKAPPPAPPLTLQPPPGTAFEPHQPSALRTGENVPVAEQGGLPPGLNLRAPLGDAFEPHQPSALRSGENIIPASDRGGLPPSVNLRPPLGNAFEPHQPGLPFGPEGAPTAPKTGGPRIQENVQISPLAEHHVLPGSTLITEGGTRASPDRFIAITPQADGTLRVTNTWAKDAGKGAGQKSITDALDYANGRPLTGDSTTHISQLRALFAAQKKGLIDFEFGSPALEAKARAMVKPGYVGDKILGRSGGPPTTINWRKPAGLGDKLVGE